MVISKSGCGEDWLDKGLQGCQFYACSVKDKVPVTCPQITWLAYTNGLTE